MLLRGVKGEGQAFYLIIMLVDEAKIHIKAGRGGDGAVSFRREKYVPRGGPDGGDGGDGGDIIFHTTNSIDTLFDYSRLKDYKAENGYSGAKARKHGKNGGDLILRVPPGTVFYEGQKKIADLKKEGEDFIAASGGKGGLGNDHFKTATNQTPREFTAGKPGEQKDLRLVLKLIADVGIIGLPNAGKSTLISAISHAKPKIADYPFTTLEPVLGVASYDKKQIILADIPGLIEGASEGKGLGHKFLRHIERTKLLLHLIDASTLNLQKDYETIRRELEKFNKNLAKKPEIIVLSKTDLVDELPKDFRYDLAISAATGKGIKELLQTLSVKL